MNIPLGIAFRYLISRKSSNIIGWISAISVLGMAVGAAAMVLVLSIYNGFDAIVRDNISKSAAPYVVVPVSGKTFSVSESGITDGVQVVQERVMVMYDGMQDVALAKGRSDVDYCLVSADLAGEIGFRAGRVHMLELVFPKRDQAISLANPAQSLNTVKVRGTGVFSVDTEYDQKTIILPIAQMRALLDYSEDQVTSIELQCEPSDLPENLCARDRVQQHPELYKMLGYEKISIYLILIFVVLIISFNIFAGIRMLCIEKQKDMFTLSAMGLTWKQIRRIFELEGILITLVGLVAGLVAGVILALIQQHFGVIPMPGTSFLKSYPVLVKIQDIVLSFICILAVGAAISKISAKTRI